MLHHAKGWLAALLFAAGCVVLASPAVRAQDKDEAPFLSKSSELTAEDKADTKLKKPCKVFKLEMKKGTTYKIEMRSPDFDTFLRVEDATGKEVAFNDDIDLANKDLNSRIIYRPRKTGEFNIIATCYQGSGPFTLEVVRASAKEETEAVILERIENLSASTPVERRKLILEVTKALQSKEGNLTGADAQLAFLFSMEVEVANVELAKETYPDLIKIFEGAENKQLAAGISRYFKTSLKNLDKIGKEFDLKKLKGKVVLVDFWGTWCPPCVAEIPNIVAMHKRFHAKGFEVIGVTSDKNDEVVTKFVEARKLPWACINVEDSRKLIDANSVNAFPTTYLIGPDGRVASLRARGPQLERLLERMLGDKK